MSNVYEVVFRPFQDLDTIEIIVNNVHEIKNSDKITTLVDNLGNVLFQFNTFDIIYLIKNKEISRCCKFLSKKFVN